MRLQDASRYLHALGDFVGTEQHGYFARGYR